MIINAAVMNPGGRHSRTRTAFSVSEVVNEEMDKLLQQVNEEGDFGKRTQELLKALVRISSPRSHTNFIAVPSSQFNVMGVSVC
jgi:hypothetical protein